MKVIIKKSTRSEKKLMAIFSKDGKKVKTTHFGASGYTDFLMSKDKERRSRYIKRHTNNRENHGDYKSAGALSRFILWGPTTSLTSNINRYKMRFNLS